MGLVMRLHCPSRDTPTYLWTTIDLVRMVMHMLGKGRWGVCPIVFYQTRE